MKSTLLKGLGCF